MKEKDTKEISVVFDWEDVSRELLKFRYTSVMNTETKYNKTHSKQSLSFIL